MDIFSVFEADGAFICGDRDTGVTVYSYPTSANQRRAKRDRFTAAIDILRDANAEAFRGSPQCVAEYDARNWERLCINPIGPHLRVLRVGQRWRLTCPRDVENFAVGNAGDLGTIIESPVPGLVYLRMDRDFGDLLSDWDNCLVFETSEPGLTIGDYAELVG